MKNLFKSSIKNTNYVLLFIASMGIGYGITNEVVYNKSENGIILIMAMCLLVGYSTKTSQSKV
jgi:hypothetical protein